MEPEGAAEEVSPGQILKALYYSSEHLVSVRDALAKDSDSSLVGVVPRMRSDLSDRVNDDRRDREAFQTKLFSEMQNFADLLSKSATEAVIEASDNRPENLQVVCVECHQKKPDRGHMTVTLHNRQRLAQLRQLR